MYIMCTIPTRHVQLHVYNVYNTHMPRTAIYCTLQYNTTYMYMYNMYNTNQLTMRDKDIKADRQKMEERSISHATILKRYAISMELNSKRNCLSLL